MNECEKYQEMISAMLDGELGGVEHEQLIAHMSSCAECRELYELLSAVTGSGLWELPEAPEGLHEHIMSGVKAAAAEKKKQGLSRRLRPWMATAACLVLIAGVIFGVPRFFRMGSSGTPSVMNSTAAANSAPADQAAPESIPSAADDTAADNNAGIDESEYVNSHSPAEEAKSGATVNGPEDDRESDGSVSQNSPDPASEPEAPSPESAEPPTLDIDIDGSSVTVESSSGGSTSEKLNRDDTLIWLNAIIEGRAGLNITAAKIEIYRLEGADYEVYLYREDSKLMGSLSDDRTNGVELKTLSDFSVFEEMADSVK